MNRSTPGLPVHHQLLEFTETHVHRVSDAIQPSHVHKLKEIGGIDKEITIRLYALYKKFSLISTGEVA